MIQYWVTSWPSVKNFLVKERHWFWYRIDILENANETELSNARTAAEKHENDLLPRLGYTEQKPEWVLLYEHIKRGQITPEDIKHMHRIDLEYIAGMSSSPPELKEDEAAKLRENVARASAELQRRNTVRTGLISAVVGAIIGAIATIASGLLKS